MGRPKNGTDNKLERVLTRQICQEVFLASGLKMTQLETLFGIGTADAWGRKTSKTFSRYIESDPSKSRAASRDTLQRIVRMSIEKEWLSIDQIRAWNLHDLLALDHQHASTAFESRKIERDALVKSLRDLRAAAVRTKALMSSASSIWVGRSMEVEDPFLTKRQELLDLLEDVAPGLSECIAPNSIQKTLDLLERQLDQSIVVFRRGQESVPVIKPECLATAKPRKAKLTAVPIHDEDLAADLSDLDNFLKSVEASMT